MRMPFSIAWQARGTFIRFWGCVDLDTVTNSNDALWLDPRFDDHTYCIYDLRDVEKWDVAMDQAKVLAALDLAASQHAPRLRLVFLAHEAYSIQFVEAYIQHSRRMRSPWDFVILKNEDEAVAWLGLDDRTQANEGSAFSEE